MFTMRQIQEAVFSSMHESMVEKTAVTIRLLSPGDESDLDKMLEREGITPEDRGFRDNTTFIAAEDGKMLGFATVRVEHLLPYVVHFCVDRRHRGKDFGLVARTLWASVNKMARLMKAEKIIVNTPLPEKSRISGLMRRYFGIEPYASKEGHSFFCVEVEHGKH